MMMMTTMEPPAAAAAAAATPWMGGNHNNNNNNHYTNLDPSAGTNASAAAPITVADNGGDGNGGNGGHDNTNHENSGYNAWQGLACNGCHTKQSHRRWAYCTDCLLQGLGCMDIIGATAGVRPTADNDNNNSTTTIEQINLAQHVRKAAAQRALADKSRDILSREWQLVPAAGIDGLPMHLALHLLEIHWNVHHNLSHLTSRAGIVGELLANSHSHNHNHSQSHGYSLNDSENGYYTSPFLLNAIFACASQCSDRAEFRNPIVVVADGVAGVNPAADRSGFDSPALRHIPGRFFFLRCERLLRSEHLLDPSRLSLATISGLLLLASAYTNAGSALRGRVYVDLAVRAGLELGLHADAALGAENSEELEARRRVFWAASVFERLQLLYTGEPVLPLGVVESEVLLDFLDPTEEFAPVRPAQLRAVPFNDSAEADAAMAVPGALEPSPLHGPSALKHTSVLLSVVSEILNELYCANPTAMEAEFILMASVDSLRDSMPPELTYEPQRMEADKTAAASAGSAAATPKVDNSNPRNSSSSSPAPAPAPAPPPAPAPTPDPKPIPSPQVVVLNVLYHSATILLFRPFVANPVLSTAAPPARSWNVCYIAARYITETVRAYARVYSLRGAEYFLGFSIYAACTIHARNAVRLGRKPLQPGIPPLPLPLPPRPSLPSPTSADARELLDESMAQLAALARNAPGFQQPLKTIVDLVSACEDIEREAVADRRRYAFFMDPIAETFADLWPDEFKSAGQRELPNDSLIGFM